MGSLVYGAGPTTQSLLWLQPESGHVDAQPMIRPYEVQGAEGRGFIIGPNKIPVQTWTGTFTVADEAAAKTARTAMWGLSGSNVDITDEFAVAVTDCFVVSVACRIRPLVGQAGGNSSTDTWEVQVTLQIQAPLA